MFKFFPDTTNEPSDVEIICLVDKSGSMSETLTEAIDGFNDFLKEQQALPGTANFTLVLFDDEWELVYDHIDLHKAKKLTKETFKPHGNTALYDAIFRTIKHICQTIEKANEASDSANVIFMILTDGEDNSSREFTAAGVAEAVTHHSKELNWEFYFLTTSRDAYEKAPTLGFSANNTHYFKPTKEGIQKSFSGMTLHLTKWRRNNTPKPPTRK